ACFGTPPSPLLFEVAERPRPQHGRFVPDVHVVRVRAADGNPTLGQYPPGDRVDLGAGAQPQPSGEDGSHRAALLRVGSEVLPGDIDAVEVGTGKTAADPGMRPPERVVLGGSEPLCSDHDKVDVAGVWTEVSQRHGSGQVEAFHETWELIVDVPQERLSHGSYQRVDSHQSLLQSSGSGRAVTPDGVRTLRRGVSAAPARPGRRRYRKPAFPGLRVDIRASRAGVSTAACDRPGGGSSCHADTPGGRCRGGPGTASSAQCAGQPRPPVYRTGP